MTPKNVGFDVRAESLFVLDDSSVYDPATKRWHGARPDTIRAWQVTAGPNGAFTGWIDEQGRIVETSQLGFVLRRLPYEVAFENWRADAERQLRDEYAVLGYLASCHPMDLVADTVRAVHAMPATALGEHVGKLVTCVGMLTTGKPVHTIKDEPMEFVTFDDGHGLIETVIFPDVYRKVAPLLFGTGPYVMRGKVEESYGAVTLTVTALDRLDRYAQRRNLPWRALSVT